MYLTLFLLSIAKDILSKKKVAIKVEAKSASFPLVVYEANVTIMMHHHSGVIRPDDLSDIQDGNLQSKGFAQVYDFG